MGLFDWFRKPKPAGPWQASSVPLPQLCYDMAYFILPEYAFNDLDKLIALCSGSQPLAGPFFYTMAVKRRGGELAIDDAKKFQIHTGELRPGVNYFVIEYPEPPPFDMASMANADSGLPPVLSPYFTAVIQTSAGVQYFNLGQSPLPGRTTLRKIEPGGTNRNQGQGPEPTLAAFLDAVRERV